MCASSRLRCWPLVIDEQANITLNGERTSVSLRVNASFKSGSFGIDFSVAQSLVDQALALFKEPAVVSARQLAEQLGFAYKSGAAAVVGLVGLVTWLRNRKIKNLVLVDDGRVRVEVDADSIVVERVTIELLRNFKLRQALERAIAEPLGRDGFESVAIATQPTEGFVVIDKSQRAYFAAPPAEQEELADELVTVNLQLVNISFKDDNKWRFYDGSNSFHAPIRDDVFLHKVKMSEATFSAGDILQVHLRKRQWLEADVMKSEFEVIKVLSHRRGMAQLPMPFIDDTPAD